MCLYDKTLDPVTVNEKKLVHFIESVVGRILSTYFYIIYNLLQ